MLFGMHSSGLFYCDPRDAKHMESSTTRTQKQVTLYEGLHRDAELKGVAGVSVEDPEVEDENDLDTSDASDAYAQEPEVQPSGLAQVDPPEEQVVESVDATVTSDATATAVAANAKEWIPHYKDANDLAMGQAKQGTVRGTVRERNDSAMGHVRLKEWSLHYKVGDESPRHIRDAKHKTGRNGMLLCVVRCCIATYEVVIAGLRCYKKSCNTLKREAESFHTYRTALRVTAETLIDLSYERVQEGHEEEGGQQDCRGNERNEGITSMWCNMIGGFSTQAVKPDGFEDPRDVTPELVVGFEPDKSTGCKPSEECDVNSRMVLVESPICGFGKPGMWSACNCGAGCKSSNGSESPEYGPHVTADEVGWKPNIGTK